MRVTQLKLTNPAFDWELNQVVKKVLNFIPGGQL